MSAAPPGFTAALQAIPEGHTRGTAHGRLFDAVKTTCAKGRSVKLVAHEAGGRDYISLNLYHLSKGAQVFPCEMSLEKVAAFVRSYRPNL